MTVPGPGATWQPAPGAASGAIWDGYATWWKATFTGGADVEYELEILPLVAREMAGCRRILDVGCGEGQVARHLAAVLDGPELVGVDPSRAQLANARAAGGPVAYVQAAGELLPFAAASFDGILCSLAIEHVEDGDALLGEVARVLAPGGTFLLLVNHPLYQGTGSGLVDDQILGERYWRVGPYLAEAVTVEEVDPGVAIPFAHRPLSRYLNPLAEHDLLCTRMLEPRPLAAFLATSVAPELEAAIPRLLAMRFEHRPALRTGRRVGRRAGAKMR
ncbi:MAG TPA: class I SAM-dependent methyltransferase [Acidimicrobiales bacterium]|nr:class I SAM-dependent methyltransferase [Acidimicrobiales bacterium]